MKVVVGLSGGVDSSVAAALLKEQGHEVIGVFMKNWSPLDSQSLTDCPWEVDQADAMAVCETLGIEFRSINFEKEYKEKVVDYLLREYEAGRTPNPDIMCNKEIKFKAFLEAAKQLGADKIATGHYARLSEGGKLLRGVDPGKDQSYFLYELDHDQVKDALFPVGHLPKSEVRALATRFNLPTAAKKDSQGICFIGHLDVKEYLQGELGSKPGTVYLLPPDDGTMSLAERQDRAEVVGKHVGVAFYTIGERAGHCIDNRLYAKVRQNTQVQSTFVVSKSKDINALYVTDSRVDVHLSTPVARLKPLFVTGGSQEVSLVDVLGQKDNIEAQIRYQQKPVKVAGWKLDEESGELEISFTELVWGAAEGQSLVLYEGEEVIGGGIVCATN